MKRLITLILATVLCMTITACSGGDSASTETTVATTEAETTMVETVEETEEATEENTEAEEDSTIYITMNDVIETDKFLMSFESFDIVPELSFKVGSYTTMNISGEEGGQVAFLKGHFENNWSSEINTSAFKISFVANDEYVYEGSGTIGFDFEASNYTRIDPLGEANFYIFAKIPDRMVDIFETGEFLIQFKDDLTNVMTYTSNSPDGGTVVTTDEDYTYAVACTLGGSAITNENNGSDEQQQAANEAYSDVTGLLADQTWFYNGGSDLLVNGITFTQKGVTVKQVAFTANGPRDNGSVEGTYTLDDNMITVSLSDGDTLEIPYTMDDETVKLGNSEYFTTEEVSEGLNGNWTFSETSFGCKHEYNLVYSSEGKAGAFVIEGANEGINLPAGEYYFFGPYNAIAMPGFGTIEIAPISEKSGFLQDWGFNIIDGEVRPIQYERIFERGSGLKGEKGYKF